MGIGCSMRIEYVGDLTDEQQIWLQHLLNGLKDDVDYREDSRWDFDEYQGEVFTSGVIEIGRYVDGESTYCELSNVRSARVWRGRDTFTVDFEWTSFELNFPTVVAKGTLSADRMDT